MKTLTADDKQTIGAMLTGAGLALWLYYGVLGSFSLSDANAAPQLWMGIALALVCVAVGVVFIFRGRTKTE